MLFLFCYCRKCRLVTLGDFTYVTFSAIFSILQIQSAADDPLTRFSALFSLICALISLFYGCLYIIQFDSMRETHRAVGWVSVCLLHLLSLILLTRHCNCRRLKERDHQHSGMSAFYLPCLAYGSAGQLLTLTIAHFIH